MQKKNYVLVPTNLYSIHRQRVIKLNMIDYRLIEYFENHCMNKTCIGDTEHSKYLILFIRQCYLKRRTLISLQYLLKNKPFFLIPKI